MATVFLAAVAGLEALPARAGRAFAPHGWEEGRIGCISNQADLSRQAGRQVCMYVYMYGI